MDVYHADSWGEACDDSWSTEDAHVVCRQFGCGRTPRDQLQPGSGGVLLDDVSWAGDESTLGQCPHSGWLTHGWGHQDTGVVSSGEDRFLLGQW